ncbi:MAG: LLM class flavin-dependent oxidoreductase [Burkholderiaceae bacterium]|nr:LLM class flavin-dependent oxidoreductase [Burkholderiaceae bacterium]
MTLELSLSTNGREAPPLVNAKLAIGEAAGVASLWCANHLFERDPVTLAALALARTATMRVTLMAMNPYTVHPVQAAMAAATLAECFPGRVSLCLGVGAPADLRAVGIDTPRPVRAMREALTLARALLAGETVRFEGENWRADGRRLASGAQPVPLVLAASGPQMLQLAGELADGVLISGGTSVEFVRWSLEQVQAGARGRTVRASAVVYAACHPQASRAHDELRRTLAVLLRGAHHAHNLQLGGSTLDQPMLDRALLDGDEALVARLVTDDIVQRHAASGTPAQVAERLSAYRAAGLQEIVIAGLRDPARLPDIFQAMRLHNDKETVS